MKHEQRSEKRCYRGAQTEAAALPCGYGGGLKKHVFAKRSQFLETFVLRDLVAVQWIKWCTVPICHLASFGFVFALQRSRRGAAGVHLDSAIELWPRMLSRHVLAAKEFRGYESRFPSVGVHRYALATGGSKCAVDGRGGWF